MTPTGAILAQVKSELSNFTSQPAVFDSFSEVISAESPRSLVIGPGPQETIEAEDHSGAVTRRFPVRIECMAWTREQADELRFEVEDALSLGKTLAQVGASSPTASFGERARVGADGRTTERVYFSTVLDFTVLYERTAA